MDTKELILNIATNLGRIARWASENRPARIAQFMDETEQYIRLLDKAPISDRFRETLKRFKQEFQLLKEQKVDGEAWAERALTWANILTHRAKLA